MKTKPFPSFKEEAAFWDNGFAHVIGIDEVGRGCFAGPVVISGVVFHPEYQRIHQEKASPLFSWLHTIHDSKLLSKKTREILSPLILTHCLYSSIVEIDLPTINTIGIGKATYLGMKKVITNIQHQLMSASFAVLVDAFTIPDITCTQKPIPQGDQKSISIAAASIIAKVYRDSRMQELAKQYPYYHFDSNKGYGTRDHRKAIQEYGLTDMHRKSFDLGKYIAEKK